ncbi:MAG: hypothetical protein V4473_01625 [Patescibacteria group bacterium]
MKKIVFIIILLIIAIGGLVYSRSHHVPVDTTVTRYSSSAVGVSFTYPKILEVGTTGNIVDIHHSIPFEHHDYCDFKGEATTTVPTLTDFNVAMQVVSKNLIDTMHSQSPYIPEENYINGEVVESPGFIDSVTYGELKGFKIFEGAEGCGQTTYYFPVGNQKTLVAKQEFITIFSGAIDADQGRQALLVPGVISKEREAEILNSIFTTLTVN